MSNAIHVECYNATHTHKATGRPARYYSYCAAKENCKLGGTVRPGQNYTWERGSGKGFTASLSVTKTETVTVEQPAPQETPPKEESKKEETKATNGQATDEVGALALEKLIDEVLARLPKPEATKLHIVVNDLPPVELDRQHKQFPTLLKALMAGVNVWLAGPSGSGKTTAAQNAAKALNRKFFYTGAVGDQYALIGYNDAQGRYVRTNFREAWEHGGIFLWDEVDASDPNALLAFNAALANGSMAFPDGIIPRHPDCLLIAAANTYGHGATHEYVGRLRLDVAFLKRFAFISWEYDEGLEMATAPNREWTKRVQAVRAKVVAKGIRVLVTPRESYIGAQLLAAGLDISQVEDMTIRSGMTKEQWDQVRA